MKANELMIGDWVRCTDPKPFRIEQIDGVEEQVYGDDGFFVDTGDLRPIPLTAEILEKNGFDMDGYVVHFKEDEHYMLEMVFEDDELRWTINCDEYTIMNFEYVHELQHALRLCGVEKEIIL